VAKEGSIGSIALQPKKSDSLVNLSLSQACHHTGEVYSFSSSLSSSVVRRDNQKMRNYVFSNQKNYKRKSNTVRKYS
jgi:hypothetical protein